MNKTIASLIFGNEMLFKTESLPTQSIEEITERKTEEKEVQEITKIAVNNPTLVISQTLDNITKELLDKILKSISKSLYTVHLSTNYDLNLYDLSSVKEIVIFELSDKPDHSIKKYSWFVKNGKHILYADSLEVINSNLNNEKRLLWDALKKINDL